MARRRRAVNRLLNVHFAVVGTDTRAKVQDDFRAGIVRFH